MVAIEIAVDDLLSLPQDRYIVLAVDKLQGIEGALKKLEEGRANAAVGRIVEAIQCLEAAEAENPDLCLVRGGLLASW